MSEDLRCLELARELIYQPLNARVEVRLPNGETRPIEGVRFVIKPATDTDTPHPRRYVQIVVGPARPRTRNRLLNLLARIAHRGS